MKSIIHRIALIFSLLVSCNGNTESQIHNGKTVPKWVKEITFSGFRYHCSPAIENLKKMNTDHLVLELRQLLKSNDDRIRSNAAYMKLERAESTINESTPYSLN